MIHDAVQAGLGQKMSHPVDIRIGNAGSPNEGVDRGDTSTVAVSAQCLQTLLLHFPGQGADEMTHENRVWFLGNESVGRF